MHVVAGTTTIATLEGDRPSKRLERLVDSRRVSSLELTIAAVCCLMASSGAYKMWGSRFPCRAFTPGASSGGLTPKGTPCWKRALAVSLSAPHPRLTAEKEEATKEGRGWSLGNAIRGTPGRAAATSWERDTKGRERDRGNCYCLLSAQEKGETGDKMVRICWNSK